MTFKCTIRNASGEVLCEMESPIIVGRHPLCWQVGRSCVSLGTSRSARGAVGSFTFTADDIKRFAAQFDPTQRFHLDEEAGRQSLFGGLAASGWRLAVCMKLLVADGQRLASEAAARGGRSRCGDRRRDFAIALDQAGAGRRYHPLCQRGRNQADLGEASRMGHPATTNTINQRGELAFSFHQQQHLFREGERGEVTALSPRHGRDRPT